MTSRNTATLVLILVLSCWNGINNYYFGVSAKIQDICRVKCEGALNVVSDKSDVLCNRECCLVQCVYGCDSYKEALTASCQQVCKNITVLTSAVGFQRQNCLQGCHFALDVHAERLKATLGPLDAPVLVRKSLTHSSLSLEWNGHFLENVFYLLQMQNVDLSSDWRMYNESDPITDKVINVDGLHPYTTYKFKVLAILTPRHAVESGVSKLIGTLPHGAPSSSPRIISLTAPSTTVISVSWTPPLIPNRPLLGYRVQVEPMNFPHIRSVTKEVVANITSWTVGQLQPGTTYMISVSAWNKDGEGPIHSKNISTPTPENVSSQEIPYLILGADHMVLKQNLLDILYYEADMVHKDNNRSILVTGIALHITKQLMYMTDTSGKILKVSLGDKMIEIHLFKGLDDPSCLTIDWLNDNLYIAAKDKIYVCGIVSEMCEVAVDDLINKPEDVKVDPINGYLYFTINGANHGLYRVDLADIHARNIKPSSLMLMVQNDNLSSFTIDYRNIQLYFPNDSQNTMLSMFMDGSEINDIRPNVLRPDFHHVVSMAYYEGLFYWTNGDTVLSEEYDPGNNAYRHNEMLYFKNHYTGFNTFHPTAQPDPVPRNPPLNVEALFSMHRVTVSWQHPGPLHYQGAGAWKDWDYEIEVRDDTSLSVITDNVLYPDMSSSVEDLIPGVKYYVKVRALYKGQPGPWSEEFIGRALEHDTVSPFILFGVGREIMRVNLDGDDLDGVTPSIRDPSVNDITWYKDQVIWATSSGEWVFIKTADYLQPFMGVSDAASLAVDWLGKKLYWSSIKQELIKRADLEGSARSSEIIYQSPARDLTIDAVNARLYWRTTHTVEATLLNGEEHLEYFSLSYISGKWIQSLTLDLTHKEVYWIVKSFEKQELHAASMIGYSRPGFEAWMTRRIVGQLADMSRHSSLQLFNGRLLWVDVYNSLRIGDRQGNYSATVAQMADNVTNFLVVHPSLHPYPEGHTETSLIIIPEPLPADGLRVAGHWSKFNLTWPMSTSVNYGQVFYEVSVTIKGERTSVFVSKRTHKTMTGIDPYSLMTVTVSPFTYWGYANKVKVNLRSPMSVPTQPRTPRVYITQRKDASTSQLSIAADLRWSAPRILNGIIHHHNVYYRRGNKTHQWNIATVTASARHYILNNLKPNMTYNFRVETCTSVGCGPRSKLVTAITDAMNPVPKLLIASSTQLTLSEVDGTINSMEKMASSSPQAMAYLAQDGKFYWIDGSNALIEADRNGARLKLLQLNGTARGMSIDWISRILFISELQQGKSRIITFDLEKRVWTRVLERDNIIGSVHADPFSSNIFWTERNNFGKGKLLRSDIHGNNMVTLFSDTTVLKQSTRKERSAVRNPRSAHCTCPLNTNIASVMAVDHSMKGTTKIYLFDIDTYRLVMTDADACFCEDAIIVDGEDRKGLPADAMTADHKRIYWTKVGHGVHSILKDTHEYKLLSNRADIRSIVAFGQHLQPLPGSECLDPNVENETAILIRASNTSVTLQLAKNVRPVECKKMTMPTIKYTLYYRDTDGSRDKEFLTCDVRGSGCNKQESFDRIMTVSGLNPYTDYLFQVAVSTYYTEYLSEAVSDPVMYRTQAGVPSSVRNVTSEPLLPTEVEVIWYPPDEPHGPLETILYKVKWSSVRKGQVIYSGESTLMEYDRGGDEHFSMILHDLHPGTSYTLKVLACQTGPYSCSESVPIRVSTYQRLNALQLLDVTSSTISVGWTASSDGSVHLYNVIYIPFSQVGHGMLFEEMLWQNYGHMPKLVNSSESYNMTFTDLLPNTKYSFLLKIVFISFENLRWPPDTHFTFSTLAGAPNAPLPPLFQHTADNEQKVVWLEPMDNGETILSYRLQFKALTSGNWTTIYNGSDTYWPLDQELISVESEYVFRVAAANGISMGPYSQNSSIFKLQVMMDDDKTSLIVAISMAALFILGIFTLVLMCITMKKRQIEKKRKPHNFIPHGPDMELATLRELPHTAIQENNTLYAINGSSIVATDEDVAALPHFRRDQLTLLKLLGSGAFCEVFEGVACNIICSSSGDTKVAVKTLHKSSSDQDKEQFLKEALLMSNFKHEHILSLLGVCLDNDPQFIILELMEGGDLLSFLRNSRPTTLTPAFLNMQDLLKTCVHVARGCKYLEDMHYVHRDLATRNCLVSTKTPNTMIVKIGDFGLARDIYKNDYYRKEGEGLLPVRWMSPESLVDGVFTTQSDIWAFGVLVWEVVTLGQQPYPARTNIDVLHYVRAGGRLERPDNCADDVYHLMLRCWALNSDDRPSFAEILEILESLYEKVMESEVDYTMWSALQVEDTILVKDARSHSDSCKPTRRATHPCRRLSNRTLDGSMSASVDGRSRTLSSGFNGGPSTSGGNGHGSSQINGNSSSSHDNYLCPRSVEPHKYLEIISDQSALFAIKPKSETEATSIGPSNQLQDPSTHTTPTKTTDSGPQTEAVMYSQVPNAFDSRGDGLNTYVKTAQCNLSDDARAGRGAIHYADIALGRSDSLPDMDSESVKTDNVTKCTSRSQTLPIVCSATSINTDDKSSVTANNIMYAQINTENLEPLASTWNMQQRGGDCKRDQSQYCAQNQLNSQQEKSSSSKNPSSRCSGSYVALMSSPSYMMHNNSGRPPKSNCAAQVGMGVSSSHVNTYPRVGYPHPQNSNTGGLHPHIAKAGNMQSVRTGQSSHTPNAQTLYSNISSRPGCAVHSKPGPKFNYMNLRGRGDAVVPYQRQPAMPSQTKRNGASWNYTLLDQKETLC